MALAHDVYLAAASHDISSKSMQYANKPIYIESSVWIATRAFIGPGVRIKTNAVIGACCAIFKDVPENTVVTVNTNYNSFLRKITKP